MTEQFPIIPLVGGPHDGLWVEFLKDLPPSVAMPVAPMIEGFSMEITMNPLKTELYLLAKFCFSTPGLTKPLKWPAYIHEDLALDMGPPPRQVIRTLIEAN